MSQCPNCGGEIIGDGYTSVQRCENAEYDTYRYHEPDAKTVLCVLPDPLCTHCDGSGWVGYSACHICSPPRTPTF